MSAETVVAIFVGLSVLGWLIQPLYWFTFFKVWHKFFPYRCLGGMDEATSEGIKKLLQEDVEARKAVAKVQ